MSENYNIATPLNCTVVKRPLSLTEAHYRITTPEITHTVQIHSYCSQHQEYIHTFPATNKPDQPFHTHYHFASFWFYYFCGVRVAFDTFYQAHANIPYMGRETLDKGRGNFVSIFLQPRVWISLYSCVSPLSSCRVRPLRELKKNATAAEKIRSGDSVIETGRFITSPAYYRL